MVKSAYCFCRCGFRFYYYPHLPVTPVAGDLTAISGLVPACTKNSHASFYIHTYTPQEGWQQFNHYLTWLSVPF